MATWVGLKKEPSDVLNKVDAHILDCEGKLEKK